MSDFLDRSRKHHLLRKTSLRSGEPNHERLATQSANLVDDSSRFWLNVLDNGSNPRARHCPREGERARAFKAVSSGMLSPLAIIFGLFVVFTAAQVWSDNDRASAAVGHEASALRTALVFAASFPGEPEAQLHDLIRTYAHETATVEWPMMARRTAPLNMTPRPLQEALQLVLSLPATNSGQKLRPAG